MKNLSIASVIEKNKINSDNALVFAMDIEIHDLETGTNIERLRVVNYEENLTIDGNEYVRFPFSLDFKDESGEIQNLHLTIQDQAGLITPYLRKYKGALKSTVLIRLVTVSPDQTITEVDFAEVFEVINTSESNFAVSFELGAENPLTRICPARTQMRDRCSFQYKGRDCGYCKSKTGGKDLPTCDLTLLGDNGCKVHNNTENYGGFPAITIGA